MCRYVGRNWDISDSLESKYRNAPVARIMASMVCGVKDREVDCVQSQLGTRREDWEESGEVPVGRANRGPG